MRLSIVIVNYNVKYFLEQCLNSVYKAIDGIDAEVYVVDNNSVDGSIAMVKHKFPLVKLIENRVNVGFSKANNQAIALSKADYVLLLNPDTLVEQDTFCKCIEFMDMYPECGALGLKMIDGKGRFLPESKRGFPSPLTSLFKMLGLSKVFPHSKVFAQYYLGNLSSEETNPVEVLSGAYMMIRRSVLDKVGLLDEQFFMYGEDVDLSYRIIKAGYKNYYISGTRIIHYKGESTKKASLNYIYTFYNAMSIFVRKHFTGRHAAFFLFFIRFAIWLAAFFSVAKRVVRALALPIFDLLSLLVGFVIIKNIWAGYMWNNKYHYPEEYQYFIFLYALIIILSVFFCGAYDKPFRLKTLFKGLGIGLLCLLVIYAFSGAAVRFSRVLIIFDWLWSVIVLVGIRILLHFGKVRDYMYLWKGDRKNYLIVGEYQECRRVKELLLQIGVSCPFVGYVSTEDENIEKEYFIGSREQLREIISIYDIKEVVFCGKSNTEHEIISMMADLKDEQIEYRIVPADGSYIIGSNTIGSLEDLYTMNIDTITSPLNRRNKRIVDLCLCVLFFIFLPVMLFLVRDRVQFIKNCFSVFIGRISWVSYELDSAADLPLIKQGVCSPKALIDFSIHEEDLIRQMNLSYAKNYHIGYDLRIVLKSIRSLGIKPPSVQR